MADLSLPAEVLLLSIDPADGGLAAPRGRVREALTVADGVERGGARPARLSGRVYRRARAELVAAGLVKRDGFLGRTLVLTDRRPAAERFHAVRRCVRDNDFPSERDGELLVLLAWAGALGGRMSRDERRLVARRLKAMEPTAALAAVAAAASVDLYSEARIAAVELGGGKTGGPSEIEAFLGSQH
jgi:hypothetical protein